MKCKLLHHTPKAKPDTGYFPKGTIIDPLTHPRFSNANVITWVKAGAAAPADDECRKAVNMTDEQLQASCRSYGRCVKGIHPDDFAEFDSGQMDGYDPKGQPIPGPNFTEPEIDEEDDEDDDD
jgi:hypothetical protein